MGTGRHEQTLQGFNTLLPICIEYLMKGSVPGNINTFHIITSQTPKFHNYT